MDDLPPFVRVERDALIAEIYAAFADVSREGGVSWSESVVMDLYGTDQDRIEAREGDHDGRWQDLVDDPGWRPDMGVGGWSFLDEIGFRYYLPAAMLRSIREGWDCDILRHLQLPLGETQSWRDERWTLLDLLQRRCVRRFIRYMAVVTGLQMEANDEDGWTKSLDRYWARIDEEGPNTTAPRP